MERLIEKIRACVGNEYRRAAEEHGKTFNSFPEAAAIIFEEFQEAEAELAFIKSDLHVIWEYIKHNESADFILGRLNEMQENAIKLACEAVQIAAMSTKATFLKDGGDKPESEG